MFDIIDEDGSGDLSLRELDECVPSRGADENSEEEEEEESDPVDRETIEEQAGIINEYKLLHSVFQGALHNAGRISRIATS